MIQFNLLPDVKLAYIKAERTKHLMISISVLASSVALAIFVVLFLVVNVAQKKNLNDLNADIKSNTSKIQNSENLNKILTVQNQLASLPTLHDQKPAASRLYKYLGQVTPSTVTMSSTSTDFTQHTMSITGNAPSLDVVNTFVDTLKFTTYKVSGGSDTNAFSAVVLSSFSRGTTGATYTITLTFDPTIFDVTKQVELTVPNTVTTRSVTEQPLFQAATKDGKS